MTQQLGDGGISARADAVELISRRSHNSVATLHRDHRAFHWRARTLERRRHRMASVPAVSFSRFPRKERLHMPGSSTTPGRSDLAMARPKRACN
jgi:hypothetical protein